MAYRLFQYSKIICLLVYKVSKSSYPARIALTKCTLCQRVFYDIFDCLLLIWTTSMMTVPKKLHLT